MKNILILDTGKEWGGGTNSLLELLRRIDKKNYKFTVLFYHNYDRPGKSDIKTEIEKLGIDFLLLDRGNQSVTAKALKEPGRVLLFFNKKLRRLWIFGLDYFFRIRRDIEGITKLLKDLNVDLLYMNNQPSSNLEGILAAKNAGIKSLLHSRIEADLNPFEIRAVNRWLTKMICVSEGVMNSFVRQRVNISKCVVIHNGIDTTITPAFPSDKVKQELGIKEDEILIGTVGSLVRRKRFNNLIKAIACLTPHPNPLPQGERGCGRESLLQGEREPYEPPPLMGGGKGEGEKHVFRIKCIIIGDGPERESLQREIDRNRLNDRVILTGFKSDAISYINAMDIFVLLSEREGMPRVILEAMLMKKPVVVANVAGLSELVIDRKTGYLVPLGKFETAAGAIAEVITSPVLKREMGMNAYNRVINEFTIDNYIRGVEKVFKEILR